MARSRWFLLLVGVLILLAAHGLALIYRVQPAVSLWFPPAGAAIALTFWLGPVGAVLTGIASVIMAPAWGSEGWMQLVGLTDMVEPLVAWGLYRCWLHGSLRLSRLGEAIAFILCGPVAACAMSSVVGSLTLATLGRLPWDSFERTIAHWWMGNAIGTMTITPVALIFLTPQLRRWGWLTLSEEDDNHYAETWQVLCRHWLEIGSILGFVVLTALLTVTATQTDVYNTQQFSLLGFIPVVWAATRFGVQGGVITASLAVVITLFNYLLVYPHAITLPEFPVHPELLYNHKLSLVLQGAIALLVGSAVTERATVQLRLLTEQMQMAQYQVRAQLSDNLLHLNRLLSETIEQLQKSEDRFRTSVETMLDCFGIYTAVRNSQGEIVDFRTEYVNEAACLSSRLSRDQQIGQGLCHLFPSMRRHHLFEEYCHLVETGVPVARDALTFAVEKHSSPIRAFDVRASRLGDGLVVTWRDVSDRRQAEQELHRHKQEFKALAEHSPDIIIRYDRQLRHLYTNPAITTATGIPAEELIGKTCAEVNLPEDFTTRWEALLHQVLATGQESTAEFHLVTPNHSVRYYQTRQVPEVDPWGSIASILVVTRDITSLKETEAALRHNQELLETVLENFPNGGVLLFDQALRCILVRGRGLSRVGITHTQFEGKTIWDAFAGEVGQVLEVAFHQALAGQSSRLEVPLANHIFDAQVLPLRADNNEVTVGMVIAQDITDLKTVQMTLQDREERLQLALDVAQLGTWYYNVVAAEMVWSSRTKQIFGLCPDAATPTYSEFLEFLHPDDRPWLERAILQAITQRSDLKAEYRIIRADGGVRWLEGAGRTTVNPVGEATHILGVVVDITERKQAEEQLQERQRFIQRVTDTVPGILYVYDLVEQRNIYANRQLAISLGYSVEEVQAMGAQLLPQLMHPDDLARLPAALDHIQTLRDGDINDFEFRMHRVDGEWRWFSDRGTVFLRQSNGLPRQVLGFALDITERKQAEEDRQKFFAMVDNSSELISMATLQGQSFYLNPAGCALVGLDPSEVDATEIEDFLPAEVKSFFRQVVIPTVLSEGYWAGDVQFQHFQTQELIDLYQSVYLVRNPDTQEPICMAAIARDTRDQKRVAAERAELLRREQAARQQAEAASRMKDEFLAIVSHELRSPLNGILGWARLLRTRHLTPEKVEQALASIERNAQVQTQLIEDLLDISRIIRGVIRLNLRALQLLPIIQAALDTVRPTASTKAITIHTQLDETVGSVLGDADRLQQIVWNLLSNAVKFSQVGGQVTVGLEQRKDADGNAYACIVVSDTGQGIKPEFLPYVFERFRQADSSSTRSHGGLGLGLAIVRNLVELHGGTVAVESAGEGQGATFTVQLPLLLNSPPAATSDALFPQRQTTLSTALTLNGISILAVDDEADTRDFLKIALEQYGATVAIAADAQEALEKLQTLKPDVLLSDIGMPGQDGYALIRQVRRLPADQGGAIPAAALTAYAREGDRLQALEAGFQMHIPKPIEPVQLITVVIKLVKTLPNSASG